MDPAALGHIEWAEIGDLLTSLWIVVLFVVLFAANMIVGHNFLPSFVTSGHVPAYMHRVRIAFYGFAFICIAIALFFFVRVVNQADVLKRFWPDYYL